MSASAAVDAATERLEAIRLRADAATPGPWNDNGEDGISQTKHITRDVWMIPRTVEDVTFIAHARADVPWLRERLEAAERDAHNKAVAYETCHDLHDQDRERADEAEARVAVLEQERDGAYRALRSSENALEETEKMLAAAIAVTSALSRKHYEAGKHPVVSEIERLRAQVSTALSVCETLTGKIACGNRDDALLEIEWLARELTGNGRGAFVSESEETFDGVFGGGSGPYE